MEGEERSYSPIPATEAHNFSRLTSTIPHGVSVRTTPLPTYTFKIEGFSILLRALEDEITQKYTSSTFEVGGYKWRLDLFPEGDTQRDINTNGYLSLYLVAVETNTLPTGWEVNVDLKLCVYNQIRDAYYFVQDGEGKLSRFNQMRTENGFARLISQATFNNASNGYLVDDTCSFGAEVFVIRNNTRKVQSFSASKCSPYVDRYKWKLPNFSKINVGCYKSDAFSAAGKNWNIEVCNREKPTGKKYVALYLNLIRTESYFGNLNLLKRFRKPEEGDFFILCNFKVRDQVNGNHREKKVGGWFRVKSNEISCEVEDFLPLDHLEDPSKGFLLNDTLVIEIIFERIREVTFGFHQPPAITK